MENTKSMNSLLMIFVQSVSYAIYMAHFNTADSSTEIHLIFCERAKKEWYLCTVFGFYAPRSDFTCEATVLKALNKLQINAYLDFFFQVTSVHADQCNLAARSIYSREGHKDIMGSRIIVPPLLILDCIRRWDFWKNLVYTFKYF